MSQEVENGTTPRQMWCDVYYEGRGYVLGNVGAHGCGGWEYYACTSCRGGFTSCGWYEPCVQCRYQVSNLTS